MEINNDTHHMSYALDIKDNFYEALLLVTVTSLKLIVETATSGDG